MGTVDPNLQQEKGTGHISSGTYIVCQFILGQMILVFQFHFYINNNTTVPIKAANISSVYLKYLKCAEQWSKCFIYKPYLHQSWHIWHDNGGRTIVIPILQIKKQEVTHLKCRNKETHTQACVAEAIPLTSTPHCLPGSFFRVPQSHQGIISELLKLRCEALRDTLQGVWIYHVNTEG